MISLLQYLIKTEKTAKNAEDAKALALSELGIAEEDAIITITDEGSKGFLGLGSKGVTVLAEAKDAAPIIAKTFLSQVLDAMGLDAQISAKTDDKTLFTEISGEHMGLVIGKRGDTLDALQYLTSLVVNKDSSDYIRVKVDTENYRQRRKETLENLAKNIAYKVKRTKRPVSLEPMNPYERRIIHSALQNDKYVTTHSEGDEPFRRVVVTLKR